MSIHHGDVTEIQPAINVSGEVVGRLGQLESRRFRGDQWLSADEVSKVCRYADDQINVLRGEVERQKRENREFVNQIEMLRHGALPSTAPHGPDPVVIELTMRAQDEANRTIGEASAESAEILAEARNQAAQIMIEARNQATQIITEKPRPVVEVIDTDSSKVAELQQRLQDLEERHNALLVVAKVAEQHLRRWQEYLSGHADQLRQDANAAGTTSQQLRAVISE